MSKSYNQGNEYRQFLIAPVNDNVFPSPLCQQEVINEINRLANIQKSPTVYIRDLSQIYYTDNLPVLLIIAHILCLIKLNRYIVGFVAQIQAAHSASSTMIYLTDRFVVVILLVVMFRYISHQGITTGRNF